MEDVLWMQQLSTLLHLCRPSLTKSPAPRLDAISTSTDKYDILLADFPAITTPSFVQQPTKHGVEHFITTKGPPVHVPARRLPPDELAAAKAEFCSMEFMGIIRRSSSPWASPLHMVPCKIFRRLAPLWRLQTPQ